ncbi:hypothetical protein TSUD_25620 [Trifolium subterraneum]|uniref:Uncharacterized protein n=1 Tax=Trifolium subterraneum TaxID=3900 RepID=A0A2Z6NDK5_TRISU|nr:hypothetical protein TSUD_25620 [Trifolium subterraneum]
MKENDFFYSNLGLGKLSSCPVRKIGLIFTITGKVTSSSVSPIKIRPIELCQKADQSTAQAVRLINYWREEDTQIEESRLVTERWFCCRKGNPKRRDLSPIPYPLPPLSSILCHSFNEIVPFLFNLISWFISNGPACWIPMCYQKRTEDGTVGALENSVAVLSGIRNHGLEPPPMESLVELKKMLKHSEEAWGGDA